MRPKEFVEALAEVRLDCVFNPYADVCEVHDRPDADAVRRKNLQTFLEAALTCKARTIWIGRDLGYRGGRRTGIALTDEIHLGAAGKLVNSPQLRRATRGLVVAERTAAVVWKVLNEIRQPVVLWNVFPLHPHERDDQLSNRCHTRTEREATRPLLTALIEMFDADRLVAIGRDAQLALSDIDIPITTVRHPSYGGQSEFSSGLYNLYGLKKGKGDLFDR